MPVTLRSSPLRRRCILIDAGLSVRELTRRLAEIGEKPEDLDAVVVTHEHSDHVSGLARLVRACEKKKKKLPDLRLAPYGPGDRLGGPARAFR